MFLLKGEEKLKPLGNAVKEDLCEVSLVEKIMGDSLLAPQAKRSLLTYLYSFAFCPKLIQGVHSRSVCSAGLNVLLVPYLFG